MEILDLAFAVLYLGEGAKNGTTSLASSDPKILHFVLAILNKNYSITRNTVKCELHLRADQDPELLKQYWSEELRIPLSNFKKCYIDQRTIERPTYDHYKGACVFVLRRYCYSKKIDISL